MRGDGVNNEAISGLCRSRRINEVPGNKQLYKLCPEPDHSRIINEPPQILSALILPTPIAYQS